MERYVHARVHVKISNGVTNAGESSDRRDGEMPCRRPEFSRTRENFCLDDARLDIGELGRDDSEPNRPCRASRVACEMHQPYFHTPPHPYFRSTFSTIERRSCDGAALHLGRCSHRKSRDKCISVSKVERKSNSRGKIDVDACNSY